MSLLTGYDEDAPDNSPDVIGGVDLGERLPTEVQYESDGGELCTDTRIDFLYDIKKSKSSRVHSKTDRQESYATLIVNRQESGGENIITHTVGLVQPRLQRGACNKTKTEPFMTTT